MNIPECLLGFLFVSSECFLILIMHPGSQVGLRDLVAQEEIGNVQPINLSITLEGQQG